MTTKENTAQAGQQGGESQGNTEGNYSLFIDQVTRLVLRHNNGIGYPFTEAMQVAKQHGINQDAATTAMRESRLFCTAITNGNLFLSYRGAKL